MTYGQIDQPTKSKNMLDKYIDAYYRFLNYNNPQLQANKTIEKDGASVFDGYFGGSNSGGTPFIGQFDENYIPVVNTFARTIQPNYLIKPRGGI